MIVVDIETSGGLDPYNIGIWQIGAIDLNNPNNTFLEESSIDDSDRITEESLKVTGKTPEDFRDKNKQPQKQLLINFFNWVNLIPEHTIICQKPQFDYTFLYLKSIKYNLECPFKSRAIDLHSIAFLKYFQVYNKLPLEKDQSTLSLSSILNFCGIQDERVILKEKQVIKQGKPHNGLEDAKLEAECFSRIVFGKPLLDEYKRFSLPDYLKS